MFLALAVTWNFVGTIKYIFELINWIEFLGRCPVGVVTHSHTFTFFEKLLFHIVCNKLLKHEKNVGMEDFTRQKKAGDINFPRHFTEQKSE